MTEEIFLKLKNYENFLSTAHKANYVRGLMRKDLDDLILIAKELGIEYKRSSCSVCNLNFVKRLAALYYEYGEKERLDEKRGQETNNTGRKRKGDKLSQTSRKASE